MSIGAHHGAASLRAVICLYPFQTLLKGGQIHVTDTNDQNGLRTNCTDTKRFDRLIIVEQGLIVRNSSVSAGITLSCNFWEGADVVCYRSIRTVGRVQRDRDSRNGIHRLVISQAECIQIHVVGRTWRIIIRCQSNMDKLHHLGIGASEVVAREEIRIILHVIIVLRWRHRGHRHMTARD